MRKILIAVLVVMVLLNVAMLLPKEDAATEETKKECSLIKTPKIDLTEVNPGILPNLLKS